MTQGELKMLGKCCIMKQQHFSGRFCTIKWQHTKVRHCWQMLLGEYCDVKWWCWGGKCCAIIWQSCRGRGHRVKWQCCWEMLQGLKGGHCNVKKWDFSEWGIAEDIKKETSQMGGHCNIKKWDIAEGGLQKGGVAMSKNELSRRWDFAEDVKKGDVSRLALQRLIF